MLEIVKGYKQGRAVMFYDLQNLDSGLITKMVYKDKVVKLCESGEIANAKVQWWEGKAIVRLHDKDIVIDRVDSNKKITESNLKCTRVDTKQNKQSTRKKCSTTSFSGYDYRNIDLKRKLNSTVSYDGLQNLDDLFTMMATEFRIKNVSEYRKEISKKINLSKKLDSLPKAELANTQYSMALYLMNMAHDEINQTYMKYKVL